jgi:transcriptional regulator with XRE-family HTH domain
VVPDAGHAHGVQRFFSSIAAASASSFRRANGVILTGRRIIFVKKVPNPIDRHVGSRVRMRRILLGMSQEKLGEALGLTFQQVQKYEKGTNRIGASRLQQISTTLSVPPAFFFDGAPMLEDTAGRGELAVTEETSSSYVLDFIATAEGLNLNKAFARIQDPRVRKRIIDLVVSLAEDQPAPGRKHGKS